MHKDLGATQSYDYKDNPNSSQLCFTGRSLTVNTVVQKSLSVSSTTAGTEMGQ